MECCTGPGAFSGPHKVKTYSIFYQNWNLLNLFFFFFFFFFVSFSSAITVCSRMLHFLSLFFFFFGLFRATPEAHRSSQARGQIRADGCQLTPQPTSTWDVSLWAMTDLRHSLWQLPIPDPLIEPRGWIHVLMDTSGVHYCWATMGTPRMLQF